MKTKRSNGVIVINRSFWPVYPIIGEALLRLAESFSRSGLSVSVVIQDRSNILEMLKSHGRGEDADFYPCKAFTTSKSNIFFRVLDAAFFAFWVCFILLRTRPRMVYVSTDPPMTVPFVVMVYSLFSKSDFVYHVQDIHPEATKAVFAITFPLFVVLRALDAITMRKAKYLVTLTEAMKKQICLRSNTKAEIFVIPNPASPIDLPKQSKERNPGFIFCGNAGRLQRMPLLLGAIESYYKQGGALDFAFVGGGVYTKKLEYLDRSYNKFSYLGKLSPADAATACCGFTWGLLPIEDSVTEFAFPSKSSTYVQAGLAMLSICGEQTSVAQWVQDYDLGLNVEPKMENLIKTFFNIEAGQLNSTLNKESREILGDQLSMEKFVRSIQKIVSQ